LLEVLLLDREYCGDAEGEEEEESHRGVGMGKCKRQVPDARCKEI
jgi:hypothetical protein